MRRPHRGFTLIELMIVVTIIAILASVGYPSYRQYVKRAARAEAKTALLENAQFLERNFTMANSYSVDSAGNPIDNATLPVQFSPKEGTAASAKYTIELDEDALGTSTFTLGATPKENGPMDDDECGTLTIDQAGRRGVSGSRSVSECWGK
jgi:type IV pilus assembly protein PilE